MGVARDKLTRTFDSIVGESTHACFQARTVVVCAGGHSLKLAHDMGEGLHYSVLPVAESYYFTPQVLNGKVYTVQNVKSCRLPQSTVIPM